MALLEVAAVTVYERGDIIHLIAAERAGTDVCSRCFPLKPGDEGGILHAERGASQSSDACTARIRGV